MPVVNLVLHVLWTSLTVLATKGLILFLFVYGVTRLIRYLSPARHHTLWQLVILAFAALPTAQLLLPVVHLPIVDQGTASSVARLSTIPFDRPQSIVTAAGSTLIHAQRFATEWVKPSLTVLWAVVAVALLGRPVFGRIALGRMSRFASRPCGWSSLLETLAKRTGVQRPTLLTHPGVPIPFTYGFLKPRIVLPESCTAWSEKRVAAILIHELEHIKRRDSLSSAMARVVCAILWFNPLAWVARAFMLGAAEMSCDSTVLANGIYGTDYASTILETLHDARGSSFLVSSECSLGRNRTLRERITRILFSQKRPVTDGETRRNRKLFLVFCLSLPLFAVSLSIQGAEKLYGRWQAQNPPTNCLDNRFIWNEDGTGSRATSVLPEVPAARCTFTIEKRWTDAQGYTWYNIKVRWSTSPFLPLFTLIRLNPSGDVLELAESPMRYPLKFLGPPGGEKHLLYRRL